MMEATLPLLFATAVGFGHAFEADHLVAVSNIVTRRDRLFLALRDGAYWGLGHTSTILLIGVVMIVGKASFLTGRFGCFEAGVGAMLIVLGLLRLRPLWRNDTLVHTHPGETEPHGHRLAYGVGLVHGLAGSGTLILLVMAEMEGAGRSLLYLLLFGLGSVAGMLVAASVLGLPFTRKLVTRPGLKQGLVLLSSLLCVGYGGWVMYKNMFA